MVWGTTGSFYDQPAPTINWDGWSRIVDIAQDPAERAAVEKFLAAAKLSGDLPMALDEKVLAPHRTAGATGEQCAYILCNLGVAALAAGTRGSAEFALGCSRKAAELAADSADLELRRRFLCAKAGLVLAVLTNEPHALWDFAAQQCTEFLDQLDRRLDDLPPDVVTSQATAAFSFTGQLFTQLQKRAAIAVYAAETSRLADAALRLADRLPADVATRIFATAMPGVDAGNLLRQVGARAEAALQCTGQEPQHAERGLAWIDQLSAQSGSRPATAAESMQLLRAELLLLAGQVDEADQQAGALAQSPEQPVRESALVLQARCALQAGSPQRAGELLVTVSPGRDELLARWRAAHMAGAEDPVWTRPGALQTADAAAAWRLRAAAAADRQEYVACIDAADRAAGSLADSLMLDWQLWQARLRDPAAPGAAQRTMERVSALPLDTSLERLPAGTALLQVLRTDEGYVTWVARQRDGQVSITVDEKRPDVTELRRLQYAWSRTAFHHPLAGAGAPRPATAEVFSQLLAAVSASWGQLLAGLLDDGVKQLILVGDDFADIPLHATPLGSGDERLIDRVPVSYVPSITALHTCLARPQRDPASRRGIALRSLMGPGFPRTELERLAAILGAKAEPVEPSAAGLWPAVADAGVMHLATGAVHVADRPFDTVFGPGWLQASVGDFISELDLPACEFVANLACDNVHPSPLRAPGFDLSTIFLAAGARTVLTSAWEPPGDLAPAMTAAFFERWVAGLPAADAFREALGALRIKRPGLPDWHWAGMRLVGAP